mmetsp:Transcript_14771/g.22946  ORF Transcript_14771/g.22946 Transcript_14771/m.22946 type:complete len:430 (-) Transcript_14771:2557-3846(-)
MTGSPDEEEESTIRKQEAAVKSIVELMQRSNLQQRDVGSNSNRHAFWDTQPMPHERTAKNDKLTESGPIRPNQKPEELRQEPYNMPKGFEWCDVDVTLQEEREEVYKLLTENYVEDNDCMFRFDYSVEFLLWALTPPGFQKQFHVGVRSSKSKRLMALITGVPAVIRAHDKAVDMVEINFLCVHKKLRSKRLAPVLIKEITRRVNLSGVFQAVYTAGVVLPVPVAQCRYYHRLLDPKKLIEVGFSRLQPRMTMARTLKLYKLPAETSTPGLRPMTPDDVPSAHKLLLKYLKQFNLATEFTEEEFAHWILPRKGVVSSFVVSNESGEVTDMGSFYHLPSTVMRHPVHNTLNAAYSFYNVATSVTMKELMNDMLTLAKSEGQDVFNMLNVMENETLVKDLKFGIGDGNLQYYIYNWNCPTMESKEIGLVLL